MIHEEVLRILKEHSIVDESKKLSQEFDIEMLDDNINEWLLPILEDLIPHRMILYPDFSGGYFDGEPVESYKKIVTDIIDKSDAEISIKQLKSKFNKNEEYVIEFKHLPDSRIEITIDSPIEYYSQMREIVNSVNKAH